MTSDPTDRKAPAPPSRESADICIRVEALSDPVCESLGVDPRHPYFEFCYLPIIGPSSAWLVRRLVAGLEQRPDGFDVELVALAHDLGLGSGTGRSAPLRRTLDRVARFGLARWPNDHTYQIRRKVPPLAARQLERLGPVPSAVHRRFTEGRAAQRNPLLAAALDYAGRGWPVFPLRPASKVPEGSLAPHGLNDASCDPSVITGWWRAAPAANVGLRTGVGVDVVDLDGPEGRAALETRCPELFAAGAAVATGRGLHLYFAASGLASRAGVLPGVDVRGTGGYVVAPPSAHPGGQRYRFVDPATGATLAQLPDVLRPVPASFLDLARPDRPDVPTRTPVALRAGIEAYALRALDDECAQVATTPEGRRNDRLNRAAFAMGTLVGADALDARAAAARLLAAAQRAGLAEPEAMRTIASGLKAGVDHPRDLARGPASRQEGGPHLNGTTRTGAQRARTRDAAPARIKGRTR